jgi:hypothetical protein
MFNEEINILIKIGKNNEEKIKIYINFIIFKKF